MKQIPREAPHIHSSDSNRTVMGDVILATLPLYFMAYCYYGNRVLALALLSLVMCMTTDALLCRLAGKRVNIYDLSPAVTALLIPLMLPASIDYRVVVFAGLFAIGIAKAPFGGIGQNVFNPAAAGLAFAIACWPVRVFAYPLLFERLPLMATFTGTPVASTAAMLRLGGVPALDTTEMFLGILPGPMGATNILVILACLIFLSYRKTLYLPQTLAFVGVAGIFAALFPRVLVSPLESALLELMSGSLFFGAVFMLSDPATSPKRELPRILYGALAGLFVMLMRRFGGFEQALPFALLLANAFSPILDYFAELLHSSQRRNRDALPKAEKSTQPA